MATQQETKKRATWIPVAFVRGDPAAVGSEAGQAATAPRDISHRISHRVSRRASLRMRTWAKSLPGRRLSAE